MMTLPKLRVPEWIVIAFFGWVAAIAPFFPQRPGLRLQPLYCLIGVVVFLMLLVTLEQRLPVVRYIRDFMPLGLTLVAFQEMEFFLPARFDHAYESVWIRQDRLLLDTWGWRRAIESLGAVVPFYLESCYLLVYGVGTFCVVYLYLAHERERLSRFLTIYLLGTLLAYALFPYFPSEPPRYVYPGLDQPAVTTWMRTFNLWILRKGTIHIGVFPSAHVSSAFAAAWGMFAVGRRRVAWGLLVYAVSVSIATVYGRYHYAADVETGFAISVVAYAIVRIVFYVAYVPANDLSSR